MTMYTRFLPCCGAAFATALAGQARANSNVTLTELQQACERVGECPTDDPTLKEFCDAANDLENTQNVTRWSAPLPTASAVLIAVGHAAAPKCNDGSTPKPANSIHLASASSGNVTAGLNQSAILWGLSDFIVDRAGKELDQWAMDNVFSKICREGQFASVTVDGKRIELFPQTCQAEADLSLTDIASGAPALQSALRADLAGLPEQVLLAISESARAAGKLAKADAAGTGADAAWVIQEQIEGAPWVDSLAGLVTHQSTKLDCSTQPGESAFYFVGSVVAALTDRTGTIKWPIGWQEEVTATLALMIDANDSGTPVGKDWPRGCLPVGPNVMTFLTSAAPVVESFAKPTRVLTSGEASRDAQLQALIRLVAGSLHLSSLVVDDFSADAHLDAEAKKALKSLLANADRLGEGLASANYTEAIVALMDEAVTVGAADRPKNFQDLNDLTRILALLADISQANTAAAVDGAIERFAAPVGSYKLKRTGGWYARVNAYLGLSAALETTVSGAPQHPAFSPGLWAGVGLEGGVGTKCGVSLGLFAQAIDLGVLAAWRINGQSGDPTNPQPQVGFEQVFSPGAYLVLGLPGAPFTIAAGTEWAPELRSLTNPAGNPTNLNVLRTSLNFALDLPLYP